MAEEKDEFDSKIDDTEEEDIEMEDSIDTDDADVMEEDSEDVFTEETGDEDDSEIEIDEEDVDFAEDFDEDAIPTEGFEDITPEEHESVMDTSGALEEAQGSAHAVAIGALVVAIAAGAGVGYLAGSAGGTSSVENVLESATVTDDTLDAVVATWTYDGETHTVTAEEAIESQYSLETVMDDDGNYPAASAEVIITYVQNEILYAEAVSRGLSVSEEEALAYAESSLGISTWEEIASTYGLTEEQAEAIVTQMAAIQGLYDEVVGATISAPSLPKEDEDSSYYYDYITGLLGDEWDADAGDWASEDGTFYSYLSSCDISEDGATYDTAYLTYYVAYIIYSNEVSELEDEWTDYENTLFADAELTIYGVFS